MPNKPTMLIIMDGWGIGDGEDPSHDAIAQAKTPNFTALKGQYPYTSLLSSGEAVGLPLGQMGNSEVGHLNIGAGRVVYQELTRINKAIRTGEFRTNAVLTEASRTAKEQNKALHLLGLVSDGGVHSEISHIFALLAMAKEQGAPRVFVHVLLDGRDTPPGSALGFVKELEEKMELDGSGRIATVSGRYYTMDRDNRWERVEKGYRAMLDSEGFLASSGVEAVEAAFARGETDEFVQPTVIIGSDGQPVGPVREGDVMIMFNYRTDRMREISHALIDEEFEGFMRRDDKAPGIQLYTMTQYDATLPVKVAFPPTDLSHTLGEVVSRAGLRQLRIAETEKYPHVTFFFNGGEETPNPNEDRILIPSPKVATYDLQPEMSAPQIGETVNEKIRSGVYDLIILNYANPDMVGHTGLMPATIKAVETVDTWVGKNVEAVLAQGGVVLITADHGNAETMWDCDGDGPCTYHTSRPVPFILVGKEYAGRKLREGGSLQDVAPTILQIMGLEQPAEMTGESLLL